MDKKAWKVFLAVAASLPWDLVVSNGDLIDAASISDHAKKIQLFNPEALQEYDFGWEIDMVQAEALIPLRRAVGKNTKIMLRLGNHDSRLLKLDTKNGDALNIILKELDKRRVRTGPGMLEDLLKTRKLDMEISYKPIDTIYGFNFVHGVKTGPNAAKQNLMKYGCGTSGHSHRMGVHTEVMQQKLMGWFESGCLRTIRNVEYLPHGDIPNWCHGYLEVHVNKRTNHFICIPHFIIDYETIHDGVRYSA